MVAHRRFYGRVREAYGWSDARIGRLSLVQAEEIDEHWRDEPSIGMVLRAFCGVNHSRRQQQEEAGFSVNEVSGPSSPKELTPEQFARMLEAESDFAARYGRGR